MQKTFSILSCGEKWGNIDLDPLLIDTNIFLEQMDLLEDLSKRDTIIGHKKIPTIANFTEKELKFAGQSSGINYLETFRNLKESNRHYLWKLRTPWKNLKECKQILDRISPRVKHKIIQTYRDQDGLDEDSRYRDWALIVSGIQLQRYQGVKPGILTFDKTVRKTCESLEEANCGIETPKIPRLLNFEREMPKTR